jgi:hypothetical protein
VTTHRRGQSSFIAQTICGSTISHVSKMLIPVIILLTSAGLLGQGNESSHHCACDLSSIFNNQGFQVPGVEGATPKSARARYNASNLIEKETVSVTVMRPGEEPSSITWLHCSSDFSGAVQVQTVDVQVLELWKFDVEEKVFAYGVTLGWMGRDKSGKLIRLGTAEDKLFYDTDGSGKFKLMTNANRPYLIEVPKWLTAGPEVNHK